jgi:hypothetical protein
LIQLIDNGESGKVINYHLNKYDKTNEVKASEIEKEPREIERDYHIVDWHGTDHYGTCFQSRMCYSKEYIFPLLAEIVFDNEKLR